jgi:DnaJ like chaperone protein
MKWVGKLVGGAMGLLVGGPVGAALGALAGHLVDEKAGAGNDTRRSGHPGASRPEDSAAPAAAAADTVAERFFRITFEVMGHVAKADGRVSDREIQAARAVMTDFRLDARQVALAIGHFTRGKHESYDLSRSIMALRRACAGRPDMLRVFLEIQLRAAIAGTDLRGPARPLLTRVATMLGVGGLEFAHLEAILRLRHGPEGAAGAAGSGPGSRGRVGVDPARMTVSEAYQILDVPPAADDDAVSKAYRRQLSRHHPDKLKANGLPESMLEHAKQRTQQIIEAWEVIRATRGIRS